MEKGRWIRTNETIDNIRSVSLTMPKNATNMRVFSVSILRNPSSENTDRHYQESPLHLVMEPDVDILNQLNPRRLCFTAIDSFRANTNHPENCWGSNM